MQALLPVLTLCLQCKGARNALYTANCTPRASRASVGYVKSLLAANKMEIHTWLKTKNKKTQL